MAQTRRALLLLLAQLVAVSLAAHTIRPLTDVRYEALARGSGVVLSDGSGFVVISGDRVFRIDASGQVIDPVARRIPVPPYTYSPPVGIWTGSSYLLVWNTSDGLTESRLDRDGNPIQGSTRVIVDGQVSGYGNSPSLVRAAESSVLIYRREPGLYAQRLDTDGVPVGAEIELTHYTTNPTTSASLGSSALVGAIEWVPKGPSTFSRWRAWEIDGSSGEVRVSPVEKISSVFGEPQLIGTVRGAVLLWPDDTRLHTAAVDSGGAVTARHIIDLGMNLLFNLRGVSTLDGVFLHGTLSGPPIGFGYRATAVLNLDGSEKRGWIDTAPLFLETISSNGSRVLATGVEYREGELSAAFGVWIQSDGSLVSRFTFPRWPNAQGGAAIGCTANDCLVAWQEDSPDGTKSIRSMRIDDRGRPVEGSESVLAPQGASYPSIGRSELESLVVWQEAGSEYYWPNPGAIHARRVKQDGSAAGPALAVSENSDGFFPAVASDGDAWLVVWVENSESLRGGLRARRVLRNGTMTDSASVTGVPYVSYVGSIVWTGNEYAVVFGNGSECRISACPPPDDSVWFVTFSKNGQQIGEPKRLARGAVGGPRLAVLNAGLFVTWLDAQQTKVAQIDRSGTLLGEVMTLPTDAGWGPIASDGSLMYYTATATTPSTWRLGHLGVSATGEVSSIGFPVDGSDGVIAAASAGALQFVMAESDLYGVPRLVTFRQTLGDEGVDLHLAVDGIDSQIPADSQRVVTLTLSNQGTSTATDVVMNGAAGAAILEIIDSDGGACSAPYGALRCTWERLDAGAVHRVRLQVDFQLYGYPTPKQSIRVFHAKAGAHETDARGADNILELPYVVYRTPQKLRGVRR